MGWPDDSRLVGVSFHVSDGTSVRLGRDLAIEIKHCLDAAAGNAEDGRLVTPVVVCEEADDWAQGFGELK